MADYASNYHIKRLLDYWKNHFALNMGSKILCITILLFFFLLLLSPHNNGVSASMDYGQALTKSLLYFEAQRSGKLPSNQRVNWRANSALRDGSDNGIDLVGGYYDAGDNVKFTFPMAFTITLLCWSATEFGPQLSSKKELSNTLAAIKWGTDYLLKASSRPGELYVVVGDGDSDHACWQRPEDMTTPRPSSKVDSSNHGPHVVAETAAAMAAASIVFRSSDGAYAGILLDRARKLFKFGRRYTNVQLNRMISLDDTFYSSSGYEDELLWAAAWLHRATGEQPFLDHLASSGNTGGVRTLFSWDDKYLGAQTLVSKLVLEGKVGSDGVWGQYKNGADQFLCNFIQKGSSNVKMSPGGMAWWQPWNNFQYTTSALLALVSYSDYLRAPNSNLKCSSGDVSPDQLISFAHSQVDYILGANPKRMSYMVGYGTNYPTQVHHRGASIVSIRTDRSPVECKAGFDLWFNKAAPNPNVLHGAIVGGPDSNDAYTDVRSNYQQAEPATANTAPFVGVLARLA